MTCAGGQQGGEEEENGEEWDSGFGHGFVFHGIGYTATIPYPPASDVNVCLSDPSG